jgi:hypothetical protein
MKNNFQILRIITILGILICVFALTACNAIERRLASNAEARATRSVPTSTPTATTTATVAPTRAVVTRIETVIVPPAPTQASNPVSSAPTVAVGTLPLPAGAPAERWHNFPVMPGAIAGQDNNKGGYYYSVNATPKQIEDFYRLEMKNLGWDLLSRDTKSNDPGYLSMIFYQANYPTLTLFVSAQGNVSVVFLAN